MVGRERHVCAVACPLSGSPCVVALHLSVPGFETRQLATLWQLSYAFLLRVPSEALPMRKGTPVGQRAHQCQSLIWREDDCVCMRLLRRKNRPHGSGVMRRKCSCPGASRFCLVHYVWDGYVANLEEGEQLFEGISDGFARTRLHALLRQLAVPDAELYRLHDFRRGHAEAR